MQNFSITQRRWRWIAAFVLVAVLAACMAQMPAIRPEAPAESAVATPAAEAASAEATESAQSSEGEAVAEDSDGSASVQASTGEPATSGEPAGEAEVATPELIGGAAIPGDETYKGLPVGFTEEGLPYRGEPDAPIVMIEYSDYACPFCNRHFIQTEPAVDESYVRTGQVRVIFHDFPIVSLHPNAPAAHEAGLCVAAQESATSYWNMHSELFRSVEEWQALSDPLPVFARLAEKAGADTALYEACMASGEMKAVVAERVDQAVTRGFEGTPSFQFVRATDDVIFEMIGAQGYEEFAGIVDSALAGEMPVAAAPEAQPEPEGIPFWATAEGWQPDPARPGYNIAGDQYRGDVNAPLTVIEFSDFQCPFCERHVTETQPALDQKYVETGKVLWVYKHFPLNIHPQAPAAGIAAECAAEQGKFWEMHEALFARVDEWSVEQPSEVFQSLASEVGLDADAFATCLAEPEMAARVDADLSEGAPYVSGTPTFIIVHGNQGQVIPGALPEATFSEVLDEQLAAAGVTQ